MSWHEGDGTPDRRWALRRGIELDADLTNTAGQFWATKVTEISEEGCRIRLAPGLDLARDLVHTIKVTGLDAIAGYVIWCAEGRAGLAFSEPLHPATVQNLVMKSHYARISRHMAQKNGSEDWLPPLGRFPFDD